MPNQRDPKKKLIAAWVDEILVEALDKWAADVGLNRSILMEQILRKAEKDYRKTKRQ